MSEKNEELLKNTYNKLYKKIYKEELLGFFNSQEQLDKSLLYFNDSISGSQDDISKYLNGIIFLSQAMNNIKSLVRTQNSQQQFI